MNALAVISAIAAFGIAAILIGPGDDDSLPDDARLAIFILACSVVIFGAVILGAGIR